jgi:hypothetical protein
METVFTSRGTAFGISTPSVATLVSAVDQTLNMELGKLSQGE